MSTYLRLFLRLLMLCGILCACEKSTDNPQPSALFPLSVGQYWVYQFETGENRSSVKSQVTAAHTIGDNTWFLMEEYGERFWIRNNQEGQNAVAGQIEAVNLYGKKKTAAIFEQLDAKTIREELMFKFPAQEGEEWVTLESTIRYEGLETKIVPAGTFDCHLYAISRDDETYSHTCIAEGVGVIYADNLVSGKSKTDDKWEISELESWGE